MRDKKKSDDNTKQSNRVYKLLIQNLGISTLLFILGTLVGVNYKPIRQIIPEDSTYSKLMSVNHSEVILCFTPPSGCREVIIKEISMAKYNIFIQAYAFTSSMIAKELVKAKERGVNVRILLDKSNISSKHSKMLEMLNAGIEVKIDKVPGIAHNKVIIIDEETVITGSYNFSNNADYRNVENLLVIKDKAITKEYLNNWLTRAKRIEDS